MKHFFLLLSFISVHLLHAQGNKQDHPLMILEGSYQGKNVYIQNPFSDGNKGFCTRSVKVNDKAYAFKNESAFSIQLDNMNFKMGEKIKIEIEHSNDCKPKVIYDNSHPKRNADIDLQIDSAGVLKWEVK
ncbi:MAG: hypothetical protein J0L87_13575 [Bacteroidetes bacterium]|nr:hypothetical protein [Bacteroidota bacterium]